MNNILNSRIVLTGVGLTSPIGNDLETYRKSLLEGRSGVRLTDVRHMGELPAGVCDFEATKYQLLNQTGTQMYFIKIMIEEDEAVHVKVQIIWFIL